MVAMVVFCSFFLEIWIFIRFSSNTSSSANNNNDDLYDDVIVNYRIKQFELSHLIYVTISILILSACNIIHEHTQFWKLRKDMNDLSRFGRNEQMRQAVLL
jgi:hypothetical protein